MRVSLSYNLHEQKVSLKASKFFYRHVQVNTVIFPTIFFTSLFKHFFIERELKIFEDEPFGFYDISLDQIAT